MVKPASSSIELAIWLTSMAVADTPKYVQLNVTEKIGADESCELKFDDSEKELLHRYFAKHVYERPGAPCETFREWLRPRHLKELDYAKLALEGRKNKRAFESLRRKFIRFGIS